MIRGLFERLGLVRKPAVEADQYRETDRVLVEAHDAAREARRRRLALEVSSYRREPR